MYVYVTFSVTCVCIYIHILHCGTLGLVRIESYLYVACVSQIVCATLCVWWVCFRFSLWHECVPFCLSFFASVGFQYYLYVTCVSLSLRDMCVSFSDSTSLLRRQAPLISTYICTHVYIYTTSPPLHKRGASFLENCGMSHVYESRHDSTILCHSYVRHDAFTCGMPPLYTPSIWRSTYSHKTQSYAWHDSLIHYLAWRRIRQDSRINYTWPDSNYAWFTRDLFVRELCATYKRCVCTRVMGVAMCTWMMYTRVVTCKWLI